MYTDGTKFIENFEKIIIYTGKITLNNKQDNIILL